MVKETDKINSLGCTAGAPEAVNALGDSYFFCKGVPVDYRRAAGLYREAAVQGLPEAQYNLAYCYDEGKGVKHSAKSAAQWYRKAAEQGHPKAQNNLGNCYQWGYGVPNDDKEAFRWYSLSAGQGYSWGLYNMGLCYEEGRGVKRNAREALRLYSLAADLGNDDARKAMKGSAMRNKMLANVAMRVGYVVTIIAFVCFMVDNYYDAKAYEVYSRASDCYYKEKDYKKTVKLLKEASDMGCAPAENMLGVCYERGHGVEKNDTVAYGFYCISVANGSAQGLFNKARFYELGKIVPKDSCRAVEYYIESARKGAPESAQALKRLGITVE